MKRTLLVSGVNIANDLIFLEHFVPEFKKKFNIVLTTFAHSETIRKKAKKQGIKLYEMPSYSRKLSKEKLSKELKNIEKQIEMPIQKVIFTDPEFYKLYRKDEVSALTWLVKLFREYERIIKENNITLHFAGGSDHIFNLFPHFIIKERKGFSFISTFIPYYGLVLTQDFLGQLTEKLKFKDKINYNEYVNKIKSKPVDYIDKTNYSKFLKLAVIKKISEIIERDIEESHNIYKARGNITTGNLILYFPKQLAIKLKNLFMESFVYKKLGKGQKYAYYPLLFTEDAQIRVKYPEGYNQYEIARNICKNLPSDYKLIIKEHPVFIGQYSTKELYDLSKFPNIVIVNPKMSSKKIFEYADYIITINSTVGYEALFFDKIVFTIGTPFYNNFPGVVHINSLSDISKFMNDARKIKEKKAEIKNKLKGSVISLLQSTLKMDYSAFLSGKNIKDGVRNIVFLMEKGVG